MTFKEFKDKYLGKQVEFHSYGAGAYNQCVDLVNAYINECLDTNLKDYTEIIGTNAKDFNTKYDKDDFYWIPNTPNGVPWEGDIIVWNGYVGGGAGHVAIFESGDVNAFKSLDQNWSEPERVTEETHTYKNVSGWLRPIREQEDCTQLQKDYDELQDRFIGLRVSRDKWKADYKSLEDRFVEEVKALNKTIAQQQEQITLLNEQLTNDTKEISNLRLENKSLRDDSVASQGVIKELSKDVADLTTDLKTTGDLLREAEAKLKKKLSKQSRWDLFKAFIRG